VTTSLAPARAPIAAVDKAIRTWGNQPATDVAVIMDSGLLGMIIFVSVTVVSLVVWRVAMTKARLPPHPPLGPMPASDASKYYALTEPAIAFEAVKGWGVNEVPPSFGVPSPVDHVILTPRLLEFCTGRAGRLARVFNFLVGAIGRVDFDPTALPAGTPAGTGVVTIHTPSGRTLLVASSAFAQALDHAARRAR
jgi:hypothetical protein